MMDEANVRACIYELRQIADDLTQLAERILQRESGILTIVDTGEELGLRSRAGRALHASALIGLRVGDEDCTDSLRLPPRDDGHAVAYWTETLGTAYACIACPAPTPASRFRKGQHAMAIARGDTLTARQLFSADHAEDLRAEAKAASIIAQAWEEQAEAETERAQDKPISPELPTNGRIPHGEAVNMLLLGDWDNKAKSKKMERLREIHKAILKPKKCGNYYTYDRAGWTSIAKLIKDRSKLKTSDRDGVDAVIDNPLEISNRLAAVRRKRIASMRD